MQAQLKHAWTHGKIERFTCEDNAVFRVGVMGFGE